MIKPVWCKLREIRPKKSGFYMFKTGKNIEILYYCKPIDYILILEYDYYYGYSARSFGLLGDVFWAKMPRIPQSKLLYDESIKIMI